MISVCLACYNGEKYISEQVLSILKQLSPTDELIISDNGSTDDTVSILHEIADDRMKIYTYLPLLNNHHRHSNLHYKVSKNFEFVLGLAKGDYIFLADQDDVWEFNKVKKTLMALESYDLVLSNYSIINSEGVSVQPVFHKSIPLKKIAWMNIVNMPFHGCCMAFRKVILQDLLPFPSELITHDNWIGILAYIKGYKVGYIDIPLVKYRRHQSNVSSFASKSCNPIWFRIWYRIVLASQIINRCF